MLSESFVLSPWYLVLAETVIIFHTAPEGFAITRMMVIVHRTVHAKTITLATVCLSERRTSFRYDIFKPDNATSSTAADYASHDCEPQPSHKIP